MVPEQTDYMHQILEELPAVLTLQILFANFSFIRLSKCPMEFQWQRLLLEEQEHTEAVKYIVIPEIR